MKKDRRDFLLEINIEELPVTYIRPALQELKDAFLKEFNAHGISYGEVYLAGGARMLTCHIKDVSLVQEELSKEILGPPKRVSFDDKGNPTKASFGFAKAQGVKIEDLKIKSTPKGEYVVIEKARETQFTKDILYRIIPGIIKDIHFPKTMRWDDTGLYFARPIESLLVLFGKDSLSIKIGEVPQKRIPPIYPEQYLKSIEKRYIIDPDERKSRIKRLILNKLTKLRSDSFIDEGLLEEVNFMVTEPVAFSGEFDGKFLALPEEVLKASMSKYQRLFPVSRKGRLTNKFIAVIDKARRDINAIRRNYENILEARLKDSLFFFEEDTKKPFSENTSQLKDLIFQKDLGNMSEKIERLQKLCSFICERLDLKGDLKSNVERSALLSKADLVTHMVGEFPSLQGIMGGVYALKSNERKETALAIKEHYLPQGMDDRLPGSLEGSILAASDRIDNVVGFLGMGVNISGSFDPFGIRRNAQSFIQIIKDRSLRIKIDELVQKSIELYGDKLKIPNSALKDRVSSYIKERIEFLMGEIKPIELKHSVLEVGCFDIVDIFKRIKVLSSISSERYFLEAAKVVERTSNILKLVKGEKIPQVNEGFFKEDLERRVWKRYQGVKDKINSLIDEEEYKEATKEYAQAFFEVLHDFFDKVLVNVEDKVLRLNRLSMMKEINTLYRDKIADLAKLPQIVVK